MKGLVIPSKVRMNQDGWTMMNIFRFFFSLRDKTVRNYTKEEYSFIDDYSLSLISIDTVLFRQESQIALKKVI